MREVRNVAAFAAPQRTTGPAGRLSTTTPSPAAAPLLAFSVTARRPPPPTAAAGLSSPAAAALLLRPVVTLPFASAAGSIAVAFFVTATAAATVASEPHAPALVCPQHPQVPAYGIAPTRRWFNRNATEVVLPAESKLRKRGRFSAGAGARETAAFSLIYPEGTTSATRASPVTTSFRREEHASNCRKVGTSEVSCSVAATNRHRDYTCTAGSKSGRIAAEIPAPSTFLDISRLGAIWAISRRPSPVKYSCFVWKHLCHSGTAFFSVKFSTRGACRYVIPPSVLPCPAVLKSSLRHVHYYCGSNGRPSYREGALFQRCVSRGVARSLSSFRVSWPLFIGGFGYGREQHCWLGSLRPVSTLFYLNAFKSRTSSASSIPPRTLPQPFLSSGSRARVRNQLSRLWYAYIKCGSGLQLGSRRLNNRSRRLCTTRSGLHSCCGSTCNDTVVKFSRSIVTYSTRACLANQNSATVDFVGALKNCSSSDLEWAVSRGSSHSHNPSRNRSPGWDAGSTHVRSNNGEHVATGVRKQNGGSSSGSTAVPFSTFFLGCRSGRVASRSLSDTGKKTAGSRKSGQHLTVTFGLSGTMELSPASAGTQNARLNDVSLKLEALERELFDMLIQCVRDEKLDIVLRAAGGWVRDKLLNRRSDDIDIVIDKMTGVQFAGALNRWLIAQGRPSHAVGVVASNPEQSKHLETATCRLLGRFQVDFVHLRTETYSQVSRIPQTVAFGSPEEDASRRDFTINALFYNVHTQKVEDFTGLGLQDLRSGLLRTPLPDAEATLLDDPLRILRGVRFASRFGFRLHPDLISAAQLDKVRNALLSKVSRERIGIELKKMLTGPSAKKTVINDNKGSDVCLTEVPAEASPGNVTAVTPRQKDANSGASMQQSISRTTETEKQLPAEATGGLKRCTDSARVGFRTAQVGAEDTHFLKRISAASRSAREALLLLVRLRVVSSVFKLPEHVIVPSIPVDAELGTERPPHGEGQLAPCERDPHLQEWWVHGLRCIYALTTWLEHYFEELAGTDEMHKEKNGRTESAVVVQFRKLMEQGNARSVDFTDCHFRTLVLGCFLFPMAGRFCLSDKLKREKLLNFVIISSLKLSRKDADQVVLLVEGAWAFLREIFNDPGIRLERNEQLTRSNTQISTGLQDGKNWTDNLEERVRLGLLIRRVGPSWGQALLLAAAALQTECASRQANELSRREYLVGTTHTGMTLRDTPSDEVFPYNEARSIKRGRTPSMEDVEPDGGLKEKAKETATVEELAMQAACVPLREQRLARILLLQQKIKQAGIEEAWRLQPLYDGHAVKNVLPKLPKGPIFKKIQEEQVRWQLANPSKTREDCALHLRKIFKEFL